MTSALRHIFICGLHRSGTSILHRALRAHPDISGFSNTGAPEDEGQHLQTVFPPARDFGGPGKFCFDAHARLDETSPLVTPENREKLAQEWRRYWEEGKSLRLEKSPPNLIRMRFLQAMFPGSAFIMLVRHPLAVSYATQKWSGSGIEELLAHWDAAHRIMLEDTPHIRQSTLIRYEDFVQRPEAILDNIYQWLDIKPAPLSEAVKPGMNEGYFRQWEAEETIKNYAYLLHAFPEQFGYYFTPPYTRESTACLIPER